MESGALGHTNCAIDLSSICIKGLAFITVHALGAAFCREQLVAPCVMLTDVLLLV
jgi:hypothetical protein